MALAAHRTLNHVGRQILQIALMGLSLTRQSDAAPPDKTQAPPRVRSSHPYIRAMISEAKVRSGTFRRLVTAIEATDGIVYVEEGECRHSVRACMPPVVTSAADFRILRVLVDPRQPDWDVMSSIGHELQHALEVLTDRTLTTNEAIFFLFSGARAWTGHSFETRDAITVGDAIKNEVATFSRHDSNRGVARDDDETVANPAR